MASTTPNIGLTLPTGAEKVSRQIINANNTIIDSKMGAVPSGKNLQGEINALNSKIVTTIISSQTSIVALANTVESGETRKFYVDNASTTLTDYPASMTSYGAVRYCQITIERISNVKAVRITAVTQGGASASITGEVIGSSVYWEASPAVINSSLTSVDSKVLGIYSTGVSSGTFTMRFYNDSDSHQLALLISSKPSTDGYKMRLYDVTAGWVILWTVT